MRKYAMAMLVLAGCAHQAKVTQAEPAVDPSGVKLTQQVPAVQPASDDGSKALAEALRGGVIHFDFDAAQLKGETLDTLRQVGAVMKAHPNLKLSVEGNCDERGTTEYNLALGQRRAASARKYLVDLGVLPAQVDDVSYGAERPVDPAHTEAAWATNRRDDLRPAN
jgi:peptidoglycan-associated lipoprotein